MSNPMNWLSPSMLSQTTMHSLGWALLHFLWQGIAVAAVAAAGMAVCRRSSARYALAVGALVLMLAAPAATFFFYMESASVPGNMGKSSSPVAPALLAASHTAADHTVANHSATISGLLPPDALPLMAEAWLL